MTDRELLEKAAKAGGFKVLQKGAGYWMVEFHERGMRGWNPLLSDGDALRLAVKLRMDVEPWIHGDSDCARVTCGEVMIDERHYGDDPGRATRRAIVRAAAAIGEKMP